LASVRLGSDQWEGSWELNTRALVTRRRSKRSRRSRRINQKQKEKRKKKNRQKRHKCSP
jgi:hypothetical protein